MRFPNGAIRMTRTPGRAAKNTITVEELVDPQAMLSGIFYAFFIAQDELFDRLRPFKVPTYIGRDASQDIAQSEYHDETGESPGNLKTAKKEVHAAYTEWGVKHYSRLYGVGLLIIHLVFCLKHCCRRTSRRSMLLKFLVVRIPRSCSSNVRRIYSMYG